MKKIYLIIINIFTISLLCDPSYAQSLENQIIERRNLFTQINKQKLNLIQIHNYYPNNIGDFWEYIVKDTTTLLGQLYELKFSITKEVLNDTLMHNGKIYKKIKWENVENSCRYLPWYEYHRVNSTGNVFLYYNNQDYMLFDFSLSVGQTYSSHITNHIWKISDKYNVIGFGNTLEAIDCELLENGTLLKEKYTVAEKFGIIYYQKNIYEYAVLEGNFWGAVINGVEYGTLIVRKQTVDWKEFYPLHINEFWKYSSASGSINSIITRKIIGDTIMSDFNTYLISRTVDYTFEDTSYNYNRVDSLGNIYSWESWSSSDKRSIRLNNIVGDTIGIQGSSASCWRINSKSDSSIKFFLYPNFVYATDWYTKGLGLTDWTIEGGGGYLVGAVKNGMVYGDTTITNIKDEQMNFTNNFKLYQNYPNPFNFTTTIEYEIPERSIVVLKIFDVLGKEIQTLVNQEQEAGVYRVNFNGFNLSSGNYLYKLKTRNYEETKQINLLK